MPKILSNNPLRGGNNWTIAGPKATRYRGLVKRGVRRLMKVDPSVAKGTPDSQIITGVNGVQGGTGTGPSGAKVMGRHESKQTAPGSGKTVIRTDGVNRSLKRR